MTTFGILSIVDYIVHLGILKHRVDGDKPRSLKKLMTT